MYLKSIKAIGFKSFADKTNIEFNKNITAVVGPNGSGKSNVVDAIRWVLGEQSVKELRSSGSMSEVIFSGSASRDGLKKASVTLTFDNSDKYLKSDFNEVEIKREVYKTGENDYYINNIKVRLKDVHNLFLDTGAGQGAFNIISQGNITELVMSKPSERRVIFESAAGVLKYKKRKEEALRKLDKTRDNLNSIKLVIDELEASVIPLQKQSIDAKRYLDLKSSLENIEIALIAEDITSSTIEYKALEEEINLLSEKVNDFSKDVDSSILEKLKLEVIKIDDEISKSNNLIIDLNSKLSSLDSEKQITLERQKYNADKDAIDESLVKAKDEEVIILKNKSVLENDISKLEDEKNILSKELRDVNDNLLNLKIKKSSIRGKLDNQNKTVLYLQNKIEIVENNILNKEYLPKGVKSVLNKTGVIDTVGNLISTPSEYQKAISISLGGSTNYVVCENFESARGSIKYLKDNKLGRVTFYPLDSIKSRYTSKDILERIKIDKDFVGVASDLIKYDSKYKSVIENLLGNVLVVKDIDALNKFGKALEYKMKIVSLDGEVLFAGGSLAGGASSKEDLDNKAMLSNLKKNLIDEESKLKMLSIDLEKIDKEYITLEDKSSALVKKEYLLNENLSNKKLSLSDCLEMQKKIELTIKGIDNILGNSLEKEYLNLVNLISETTKEKAVLENDLKGLKDKKYDLTNEITTLENELKHKNSEINKVNNELKDKEVLIGKLEVKLENLLFNLSDEYNLTYEGAKDKYFLDSDKDDARSKVKTLKKEMSSLGDVNLGSISEYERIKERYDFLLAQEDDLNEASSNLLAVIDEMDEIMISKFKETFNEVASEFKKVFKEIFQGGKGNVTLTDPEDILSTGVDIIAEPPGKKINSPIALSGGEKSLTAICLLFAILNVRPVPFIILDEAEAALDEANVDMFGKYICNKKKDSQFILITHKKRMMEYADSLYGITMQESGVSKIVSTRLEN